MTAIMMKKQQSLSSLDKSGSTKVSAEWRRRARSVERLHPVRIINSSGGSTGDVSSEGCLSRSSSTKNDELDHFYHLETTTTTTDDTGIGGSLSKFSSPVSKSAAPIDASHLNILDDSDSDNDSSRRRTIVFERPPRDDESDKSAQDSPKPLTKSSPPRTVHHVRSSSYLEVASLSSVYSNYSQFEFGQTRGGAISPPLTSTSNLPSSSAVVQQPNKSNSSGFSSFLGLFGSKPKPASEQAGKSTKFEMITSKLFSLNKPGTKSPDTSSPSSPSSTSSATSDPLKSSISSSNSMASINEAHSNVQAPNTVLIFENRPSNLPAKSQQEALKHRQEYERMVEIAKKKELKEKEIKIKNYQQQIRKEDFMANSLRIWNTEILPNWNEQKNSRRTNQLWWHGLPPPIRGKVWKLAIGNELNLTEESYYFYEKKAKMKLEMLSKYDEKQDWDKIQQESTSVELIKLDVSRTFPQLCFFQKDGPYHQPLHDVLGAYACYNTKIGYVQGMSFLTAILLLNMEAPDAFICLANLLNNKYLLACFCMDQKKMNRYFRVHQILLEYNIPKLYAHFEHQKVKPDLYLIDWVFTLFSKSLPLDVMSRVWDVFFRDQEEFLFRTALGILNLYKETLLELDFIHIVKFLTKLPDNINATQLFKSIEQIETNVDDAYFSFKSLIDDCQN